MRILRIYCAAFLIPLVLLVIAIWCWFYISDTIGVFKEGLLGTALGVGISIFAAESFKKLTEHKRIKRTFGLLKLVTVPYLKNQAENFLATMQGYNDMCSLEKALEFLAMSANFNRLSEDFDKSWLQLVYSQDFVDAINSDEHFNKIANAISEVLLFTKQLAGQSINAQTLLLLNNPTGFTDVQKSDFINRVRVVRDALKDSVEKLQKYTDALDEEITAFLRNNGAGYQEVNR